MNIPFKHAAPDDTTRQWVEDIVKKAMTNEQALSRAIELLMQVSSLNSSDDVCDGWGGDFYPTARFNELVKEIDMFLDDEMRRL